MKADEACPSQAELSANGTPGACITDPHVCRQSCSRTCVTFDSLCI